METKETDLMDEVYGASPHAVKVQLRKELVKLKVKQPASLICDIYVARHKDYDCSKEKKKCPLYDVCYNTHSGMYRTGNAGWAKAISNRSKEIMDEYAENPTINHKLGIINHEGFNANKLISVNHIFIKGEGTWFFSKGDTKKHFNSHNTVGVHWEQKMFSGITLYQLRATNSYD